MHMVFKITVLDEINREGTMNKGKKVAYIPGNPKLKGQDNDE